MERIRLVEGEHPVLILAPHGPDDVNTDLIAERVALEFGAFAVINRGWRRSSSVDCARDMANCNDVRHLHSEVVREEFLEPVLRFKNRIRRKYDENVFVLAIHGCSDSVRAEADDQDLDMIIGYGDGTPPSYSCEPRFKDAFAYHLRNEGFGVYEGARGGRYAGRARNNLNQLFVRWYPDEYVNSLQMEIVRDLRCDAGLLDLTISGIVSAMDSMMIFDDTLDLSFMDPIGKI
jgi:hypothetical protein